MKESTESLSPGDLPGIWRQRAQFLKEYGDPNSGRTWERAATELDQAPRALGEHTVTLGEAAALCGYSQISRAEVLRKGLPLAVAQLTAARDGHHLTTKGSRGHASREQEKAIAARCRGR